MTAIEQLLTVADAYGEVEGLEPKTVSWRVFGDSKKLEAIRSGSDIQVSRYERALQWFSDNWPPLADWPDEVARPVRSQGDVA
jgi:hypothetical protein